jgi:hypothetical protein
VFLGGLNEMFDWMNVVTGGRYLLHLESLGDKRERD